MRWYLDCFTDVDKVNQLHPVNSYWSTELFQVMRTATELLSRGESGIVRIAIGQTTLGMCPQEVCK